MSRRLISQIGLLVAVFFLSVAVQGYASFREPNTVPPNANVNAPLNTGSSAQAKSGQLTVGGPVIANNGLSVSNAGGAYTYITLHDDESPNGVKYVHANSNVIGFLSGQGSWLEYWHNNGTSVQKGNAYIGGNVYAARVIANSYVSAPKVYAKNMEAYDFYIKKISKWASQLGGSGSIETTVVGPVGVNDGGAGWDAKCPAGYAISRLRIIGNRMTVYCIKF